MNKEECLNLVRRFNKIIQMTPEKEVFIANMLENFVGNGDASYCRIEDMYEDLRHEAAQFGIDPLLVALMAGTLYERESMRRHMNMWYVGDTRP